MSSTLPSIHSHLSSPDAHPDGEHACNGDVTNTRHDTTYLSLVRDVMVRGDLRGDRTGTGTLSLFGTQSRYDLGDGFPLLTTKSVRWSSVVRELLWFLRGQTNVKQLGCGIWDEWADGDGELGPIYGAQWRRWSPAGGPGAIDQVAGVVSELRSNPESRRLIVSAWNVSELPQMALPPCHVMWQLYSRAGVSVGGDGVGGAGTRVLDLHLYQRSADLALGVPFNIASYALLLMMIARSVGMVPGTLVHTIGDAHVYVNHVDGLRRQLEREARPSPRVEIVGVPDFSRPERMTMEPGDFKLHGYDPHPAIRFDVAV